MIEKEIGELFLFICPNCRGIYDCEFVEDGLCLCPFCDEKKIDSFEILTKTTESPEKP